MPTAEAASTYPPNGDSPLGVMIPLAAICSPMKGRSGVEQPCQAGGPSSLPAGDVQAGSIRTRYNTKMVLHQDLLMEWTSRADRVCLLCPPGVPIMTDRQETGTTTNPPSFVRKAKEILPLHRSSAEETQLRPLQSTCVIFTSPELWRAFLRLLVASASRHTTRPSLHL
ncbi:hypothetical protein NDU88_006967 [Pleurodeles waltl]|uniref:Uncharacterized protein n=1 Tax=Pleurodeles waltl TaxID=8319 RepID=A0AAV7VR54_PLEWA|nr:hypothetical protein NDU88_006967 [Pleurodeles waltl]